MPTRPDELALLRNYGLRYDFPDVWYSFYCAGVVEFTFDHFKLPMNQQNFKVKSVQFRVVTKPDISNQDIERRITGPNGTSGIVKTNADGVVSSESPQLNALAGADPLGIWKVEVVGGVPISEGGTMKFDQIYNLQFGLEYIFEYLPEVI